MTCTHNVIELDKISAITVDTSVFDNINYNFNNILIKRLIGLNGSGIRVIFSEITIKEIKKHMLDKATQLKDSLNSSLRKYSVFFMLDSEEIFSTTDSTTEPSEFVNKEFAKFINDTGSELISLNEYISIENLFASYFDHKPPFGDKNKKSEFPDAAVLLSIEQWAEQNNIYVLAISHDPDWDNYCKESKHIRFCHYDDALSTIDSIMTTGGISDELLEQIHNDADKTIYDGTAWVEYPDAIFIACAILVGVWNDKNENDIEIVAQLFGISYSIWFQKAREILRYINSPLTLNNGIWKIEHRLELWNLLATLVLDQDFDKFERIATLVLKEIDPALELPKEERYAASVYGKKFNYSGALRKGIAEGLAILGTQPITNSNCSLRKAENTSMRAIREIFMDSDWTIWASLGSLLPILAEAAPDQFLEAVEKPLSRTPCIFDELFAQESGGSTGRNYLVGLLWALEGIAWDENYFVRACVALGDLASRDPGGPTVNRPINSLVTILLPWLPQTIAPIDKRIVAVETLLKEQPDVGWHLILGLLPRQHGTSFGSYKPVWRKTIPDNWGNVASYQDYLQQITRYAEFAIHTAEYDVKKLIKLIECLNDLPQSAFEQLITILGSQHIYELSEEPRHLLWTYLVKLINEHKRFPKSQWTLSRDSVASIENIANQIAPITPFYRAQPLFSDNHLFYDEDETREEQREKLDKLREIAIKEILDGAGIEAVIAFSDIVKFPHLVARALAYMEEKIIEQTLLPSFLNTANKKHNILVSNFIYWRHDYKGWIWFDSIDKSNWTQEQIGDFLSKLPYTQNTLDRISIWLKENQKEYWSRANVNAIRSNKDNFEFAIEKLIEYGRAFSAINCLAMKLHDKQIIKPEQCVRVLLEAPSCTESSDSEQWYDVAKLIEYVQSEPFISLENKLNIEWAYLVLLDGHLGITPKYLESKLADEPEFFCEILQKIYHLKTENSSNESPSNEENSGKMIAIAEKAWRLLHFWKTPPGINNDGSFSVDNFNEWIARVKIISIETGHFEVAMNRIGKVLIYAPADPDGLWIHKAIATALNVKDAEEIRNGFLTGIINSRGVHTVDPSGTPEKLLAKKYRYQAEELEKACFPRFATILKKIANDYEDQAIRIQQKYQYD